MTARWPLVLNGTTIQELQTGDTLNGVSSFDAGTAMLFAQTAAPTGWTKSTTHNDKALRVVSGTASSGGSYTFSSTFANGNTGAFTLSANEMPGHNHAGAISQRSLENLNTSAGIMSPTSYVFYPSDSVNNTVYNTITYSGRPWYVAVASNGGGGSHSHSLSLAVQYVDVIIATKD